MLKVSPKKLLQSVNKKEIISKKMVMVSFVKSWVVLGENIQKLELEPTLEIKLILFIRKLTILFHSVSHGQMYLEIS